MGVKQNQKKFHRLHHPRSGRLHVAAMSLTGDEGSSSPMSFLGKEKIERCYMAKRKYRLSVIYSLPRRTKPLW
jgi:hypothetical protein